jgi:genome maintenance exonuclease 1
MIIKYGIERLDEIWGIEAQVYYPELWFGIIDLVGIHRGEPAVIDFKNSKQMKKESWLTDYKIQLASYIMAHNKLYHTNIKKGVIMMASRDGKYKEFILEGDQLESLTQVWLQKVYQYYNEKDYKKIK